MRRLSWIHWAPLALLACGLPVGTITSKARGIIVVEPPALDFGSRAPQQEATATVTLGNQGTVQLTILGSRVADDARGAFFFEAVPASLAPSQTATVTVHYRAPAVEGPDGATLVIESDADNTRQALISLAGRSVNPCDAGLTRCTDRCVNLVRDPLHCGGCGLICESGVCENGKCQAPTCSDKVLNGDELGVDCGGPTCKPCGGGLPCKKAADCASKVCGTSGQCATPTCKDSVQNGDEAWADCGGSVCAPCPPGSLCNGVGCASPPNAVGRCENGRCLVACKPGFDDCDHDLKNGCEVDRLADASNCGKCGAVCAGAKAKMRCQLGQCQVELCDPGYGNCNRDVSDGCEAALNTTLNCGTCQATCQPPSGTASCASGKCVIQSCAGNTADCDKDAQNGCEADLLKDPKSCGVCGKACTADESCTFGRCVKGYGDGRDGAFFTQPGTSFVSSVRSAVTQASDKTDIAVTSSWLFSIGQLVLVHQTQDIPLGQKAGPPSGHWELATVGGVSGNVLQMKAPLKSSYDLGAQVVVVPQFTTVDVPGGSTITSPAWDPRSGTGGLLVFQAKGAVAVAGAIFADGKGFRSRVVSCPGTCQVGGIGESNLGFQVSGPPGSGGGGGGAGVCGGGGGGSHATRGLPGTPTAGCSGNGAGQGQGGNVRNAGSDLSIDIMFGSAGGGGGGSYNTTHPGAGGNGGGIILIFAGSVKVTGSVTASGADGVDGSPTACGGGANNMGGGGGGAGGTIRIAAPAVDIGNGLVRAMGGIGGRCFLEGGSSLVPSGGFGGEGRIGVLSTFVSGQTKPAFDASN